MTTLNYEYGTNGTAIENYALNRVFKYTVAGSLLGSWTISTAGVSSPTGITLDPANPSHLWIVDSGSDRVYQYDAAIGRTSGSQSAAISFALSAGNTNPQGIADPPVGQASSLSDSVWEAEQRAADPVFGDDAFGSDEREDRLKPGLQLAEFSSEDHDRALMTLLAELDFAQSRGRSRRLPWTLMESVV